MGVALANLCRGSSMLNLDNVVIATVKITYNGSPGEIRTPVYDASNQKH